jgi:hypothetical protein
MRPVILAMVEFKRSQLMPARLPVGGSITVRVKQPDITNEVQLNGG